MKWNKYRLQEFSMDGEPRTPKCVVEAPSPGVVVEYFLAVHGMLSYYRIVLSVVNIQADEDRAAVLALMPYAEELARILDASHTWEVDTERPRRTP